MRIQVFSESAFTVQGHGVHSAFLDQVACLRARPDIDLVVNGRPDRRADLVHVHTAGPAALAFLLGARCAKVASAHLVPDSLTGSIVGAETLHRYLRGYLAWFYNRADLVVAVSTGVERSLRDIGVTAPITVLPNCVSPADVRRPAAVRASIRSGLGLTPSDVLVVSVGQVQPRKGVTEFLATARDLPAVHFLWIGAPLFGPASRGRGKLRHAFETAPPNVRRTGQIPRTKVYDYLAAADIYLSLAVQETFGIAVLEAATAACPLVLSDLPVFRATYGDAAQYTDPVPAIAALAESPQLRHEWGHRAAEAAAAYGRDAYGERLLAAYRSLCPQNPSRP
jgi:1,2-diacylglycerol-3-alpha-glucose alpha-1,2-galactosyltransferase